jgi:hypothetical protein
VYVLPLEIKLSAMKTIYSLFVLAAFIVIGCNKKDSGGIAPPTPTKLSIAKFSVSPLTITYDRVTSDSIAILDWNIMGNPTAVTINGLPVAPSGLLKTGMITKDSVFTMIGTRLSETVIESKSVHVSIADTVSKLNAWWMMTKLEVQYNGSSIWTNDGINPCIADDTHYFTLNRGNRTRYGTNHCDSGEHETYSQNSWRLTGGNIVWGDLYKIEKIDNTTMVLVATVPNFPTGTSLVRKTFTKQ